MEELFSGTGYHLFLLFAVVGLIEMGLFLYRIYKHSNQDRKLKLLEQHLEKARSEDEIPEAFYERHREILEGQ